MFHNLLIYNYDRIIVCLINVSWMESCPVHVRKLQRMRSVKFSHRQGSDHNFTCPWFGNPSVLYIIPGTEWNIISAVVQNGLVSSLNDVMHFCNAPLFSLRCLSAFGRNLQRINICYMPSYTNFRNCVICECVFIVEHFWWIFQWFSRARVHSMSGKTAYAFPALERAQFGTVSRVLNSKFTFCVHILESRFFFHF